MNNFNKVQKLLAEVQCFEAIAKEAGVPLNKLDVYLKHLQDIGLIKYSLTDNFIHLTLFGKKQEHLFER